MSESIVQIGAVAYDLLTSSESEITGAVAAVFTNSLYLHLDKHDHALLCLGTSSLIEGPINVRTTLLHLPVVETGNLWSCDKDKLTIDGAVSFKLHAAQVTRRHDPKVDAIIPESAMPAIIGLIRSHLEHHRTHHKSHQQSEMQILKGLHTLQHWLQADTDTPPDPLKTLIGCGQGLTPAGDDILTGALITLPHTGRTKQFSQLSEWIKTHAVSRTNDISLAHLHAACDGQAVELLHDLLSAGATNHLHSIQQALDNLDDYGHSSGHDALRGVLAVLESARSDKNADKNTD